MLYSINISVLSAILFFVLIIAIKRWRKQEILVRDLIKGVLAAAALPHLGLLLFYLVTNPKKAMEMTGAIEYLTIAILVTIYLVIIEIKHSTDK